MVSFYRYQLEIPTQGFCDLVDITPHAEKYLKKSKIREGILHAFVPGSTAGLTTIEYEPGAIEDFQKMIERLIPQNIPYRHNERWGDGNGFSHIRASLLGPSLSVPVSEAKLLLGTWQQMVLVDFDNRPRRRKLILQYIGEEK